MLYTIEERVFVVVSEFQRYIPDRHARGGGPDASHLHQAWFAGPPRRTQEEDDRVQGYSQNRQDTHAGECRNSHLSSQST